VESELAQVGVQVGWFGGWLAGLAEIVGQGSAAVIV
jgi:hypothetical protein